MRVARPKPRTVVIFALWFLPVAVVAETAGENDSIAVGYGAIATLGCPLAFVMARRIWSVSKVLCVVGGFNTVASSALCLLTALFVASVDRLLVFGLLAALAGGVAFGALAAPQLLIRFESVAALATVAALTLIAFDSANLHHIEGGAGTVSTTESWSFLYVVWGFALGTLLVGVILALAARTRGGSGNVDASASAG